MHLDEAQVGGIYKCNSTQMKTAMQCNGQQHSQTQMLLLMCVYVMRELGERGNK